MYGQERDISMFRKMNQELLGNIVSQQAIFYKYILSKSNTNIYGEAVDGGNARNFGYPVILNCLIERGDQSYPTSDLGIDLKRAVKFAFLKDDLVAASLVPEAGDVILYQEGYYEVDSTVVNQLSVGKNPDYPNSPNPLNTGLEQFGWDVSIICSTHYTPGDKYNLQKFRL